VGEGDIFRDGKGLGRMRVKCKVDTLDYSMSGYVEEVRTVGVNGGE
jgi:hypothetical protein